MKKVGKTTKPFRYDLNQIPYDYTMDLTNRFKGLDLTDRVPEELWMEVYDIVQEVVTKTIPKKKKWKKENYLFEKPTTCQALCASHVPIRGITGKEMPLVVELLN